MRQMGSIVKKRNRYYVVYRAPDRRQKWEGGFETKTKAQRRLTEVLGQLNDGSYFVPSDKTLAEFAREWLNSRVNIKGATWANYETFLKAHVIPLLGEMGLVDIRLAHIQKLVTEMCGKKNQAGDPLSPNTIGQVITMSKQVFGDAIKHNLIRFNPVENAEVPKKIKPKVEPPDKADVLAVLDQVSPKYKLLFLMDSLTGLRRGEILALQWRDVDWLNGEISISRSICKAKATDGVHRFQ